MYFKLWKWEAWIQRRDAIGQIFLDWEQCEGDTKILVGPLDITINRRKTYGQPEEDDGDAGASPAAKS